MSLLAKLENEGTFIPVVDYNNVGIVICNVTNSNTTVILGIQKDTVEARLYSNFPILANDTYVVPFRINLQRNERISMVGVGIQVSIFQ